MTSPRLERVRLLKSRLVRLTTRVETVREVLEKFLDDDDDMHDLNLTANESKELAEMQPNVRGRGWGCGMESWQYVKIGQHWQYGPADSLVTEAQTGSLQCC